MSSLWAWPSTRRIDSREVEPWRGRGRRGVFSDGDARDVVEIVVPCRAPVKLRPSDSPGGVHLYHSSDSPAICCDCPEVTKQLQVLRHGLDW